MNAISEAFALLSESWEILKKDKEMILFSLLSGVYYLLVFFAFGATAVGLFPDGMEPLMKDWSHYGLKPYGVLFAFIFCMRMIGDFFNGAIIACAYKRMQGEDPTFWDGIFTVVDRFFKLAGWVFAISSFLFVMGFIPKGRNWIGRWIARGLDIAVSVLTFFVVPAIVIENVGPIEAIRRSATLLKDTWGEQIAGGVGLRILGMFVFAPLLFVGFAIESGGLTVVLAVLAAVWMAVSFAALNVLEQIFKTALYVYASEKKAPSGFSPVNLGAAFHSA